MAVAMVLVLASMGNPAVSQAAASGDGSRDGLVSGSGSVEPISDQVQVGSPIPGKIKYVRVAEGAVVRQVRFWQSWNSTTPWHGAPRPRSSWKRAWLP